MEIFTCGGYSNLAKYLPVVDIHNNEMLYNKGNIYTVVDIHNNEMLRGTTARPPLSLVVVFSGKYL
jgi:hypothetical protein